MLQLERELVQARLKEAESQCALKEMQDKILDMEKVGVCVSPNSPTQKKKKRRKKRKTKNKKTSSPKQRRRLLWNPLV